MSVGLLRDTRCNKQGKQPKGTLLNFFFLSPFGQQDQSAKQIPLGDASRATPTRRIQPFRYGKRNTVAEDVLRKRMPTQKLPASGEAFEGFADPFEFGIGH